MDAALVVLALLVVAGLSSGITLAVVRAAPPTQTAPGERDAVIRAAVEHAALIQREQLGSRMQEGERVLDARGALIDQRLDQVRIEVRTELDRLGSLVEQLGQRSSDQLVRVETSLRAQGEVTAALASTTQSLREALANPKTRGQWGERMAEDVLRLAGFVEHVNYERQSSTAGGRGIPDYTFLLPKGHVLYMDVKFPLAAYLRMLDAPGERERADERAAFLQDVRARVRELAAREYQEQGPATVDYVLLFLPNETISAFVHEHDPALVEHALERKVVLCSPITLFALLGVIRQAFDNFVVEQTSDRILALLGTFRSQWVKFGHSLDRVKSRLDSVQREVDQLTGPRRRQLERPLEQIDDLRRQRGVTAPSASVPEPLTAPPAGAPSTDQPPPRSRHGVLVPNDSHP